MVTDGGGGFWALTLASSTTALRKTGSVQSFRAMLMVLALASSVIRIATIRVQVCVRGLYQPVTRSMASLNHLSRATWVVVSCRENLVRANSTFLTSPLGIAINPFSRSAMAWSEASTGLGGAAPAFAAAAVVKQSDPTPANRLAEQKTGTTAAAAL